MVGENNLKFLKDLLDFNNLIRDYDDINSLYEDINRFVTDKLNINEAIIFSYPKKREHVLGRHIEQQFRHVWNKKNIEKFYKVEDIHKLLEKVINKNNTHEEIVIDNQQLFSRPLGEDGHQIYFIIFSLPLKSIEKRKYIDQLMQAACKEFIIFKKIEGLGKENQLIHIDDVTGLYNQRKLQIDLDNSITKYNKYNEEFCILFIDVDHFKRVNDGHGHLVGTFLLSEIAQILRNTLRDEDLIYRYGGDEFVVIIPNSAANIGKSVGERILKSIKERDFEIKKGNILKLSVSIGVASFPKDAKTREDVLSMADQMMYHAKESGRGKVCLSNEALKKEED
ncbi:MAG: diguanylate cyclase [Halobacteriovoraceae bacterium]|nr:diguanylate cyclase [Halobacteriovoraceae bacterium]